MNNGDLTLAFPEAVQTPPPKCFPFWKYSRARRGATYKGVNANLPGALFNDNDPKRVNLQEQPIHRRFVTLYEQGYTANEIAAATGKSRCTVLNTLRQPHARKHMIETLQQDVSQKIKDFLEGEVLPSLEVAKQIRDNELLKSSDRLAAANMFLDRQLGRPNQPFSLPAQGKRPDEMTSDELRTALAATGFNAATIALDGAVATPGVPGQS